MQNLLTKASEEPKVLRMMQEEAIKRGYAAVSPKKQLFSRHGNSTTMLSNSSSISSLYKRNNFYQDRVLPL